MTTGGHVFYASPISGSSSNVVRYTPATQASEVIGQSTWVSPRTTWAAGNRVVFTGTAGDLVLWDSGSSVSLAASASEPNVSGKNVAWFSQMSGTSIDVFLHDGSATQLLGTYGTSYVLQPSLSVADSLVTWTAGGNLYVASLVPEPSACFSVAAGLTFGLMHRLRMRKDQTRV